LNPPLNAATMLDVHVVATRSLGATGLPSGHRVPGTKRNRSRVGSSHIRVTRPRSVLASSRPGCPATACHVAPDDPARDDQLGGLRRVEGQGADRARARAMLKRVGLGERLHHFPGQLSTGQQQRVAVARALANRPKLVLADEPTGNLDRGNARAALALIREVCREDSAALLLVSHDPEVLGQFDDARDFSALNRTAAAEVAA